MILNKRAGKNDWAVALLNLTFFWRKVEKGPLPDSCWIWTGSTRSGYGRVSAWYDFKAISILVHRVSYIIHYGSIPEGFEIDHECRNTRCLNPAHLNPKTPKQNTVAARPPKSHCPSGHELLEANSYIDPKGYKHCRRCMTTAGGRWYRKRRGIQPRAKALDK